jgi:mannose-1-phosphate guanylyltransferase / mannose-6-phosphate isomerase
VAGRAPACGPNRGRGCLRPFIPLIGQRSTFQSIVSVVGHLSVFDPAVVITNFDYRFRVAEQLREIGAEAVILLEPDRRDSAAADHVFEDGKQFARLCAKAYAAANAGEIVTFGVTPDHPATGYGYIHPGAPLALDPQVRRIEQFVEKPDETRARAFIENNYLWNSGNFVFRADVMLGELQRFEPEIAAASAAALSAAKKDLGFVVLDHDSFAKAPKTSIDYAVMERTERAVVLTADVGWSDVGEWSAVWRLASRDANGNSLRGGAVVVVHGAAEVTLNGKTEMVHENESIYLPIGSTHRLANPGKIDLELIEVRTGSYFGEDDITATTECDRILSFLALTGHGLR